MVTWKWQAHYLLCWCPHGRHGTHGTSKVSPRAWADNIGLKLDFHYEDSVMVANSCAIKKNTRVVDVLMFWVVGYVLSGHWHGVSVGLQAPLKPVPLDDAFGG